MLEAIKLKLKTALEKQEEDKATIDKLEAEKVELEVLK